MINEINIVIQQQMNGVSAPILFLLSICSCAIVSIVFLLRKLIWKREGSFLTIFLYLVCSVYFCALVYITLGNRELGSRDDARWIPFTYIFQDNGNINKTAFVLMMLNIVLFLPYGFLITLIQHKLTSLKRFFLAATQSLLLSAMIEVVQRITKLGYFELEDIICNTFGGMIGWMLASVIIILYKIHQEKTRISVDF